MQHAVTKNFAKKMKIITTSLPQVQYILKWLEWIFRKLMMFLKDLGQNVWPFYLFFLWWFGKWWWPFYLAWPFNPSLHLYPSSFSINFFFPEVRHLDHPKTPKDTHGSCKTLIWKSCNTFIILRGVLVSLCLVLLLYHKSIQCVPKGISFHTIKHSKFQLSSLFLHLFHKHAYGLS